MLAATSVKLKSSTLIPKDTKLLATYEKLSHWNLVRNTADTKCSHTLIQEETEMLPAHEKSNHCNHVQLRKAIIRVYR